MYKCNSCGEVFEHPKINKFKESYEAWGVNIMQDCEEELCPNCLDEDIEEMEV